MRGSYALSNPHGYGRISAWADAIRAEGVSVDIFVHTELAEYTPKTRGNQAEAVDGEQLRSVPPIELIGMIRDLHPVKLSLHGEPGFCSVRRHDFCECTRSWPRWLEQQLKVQRCMELVRAYEAETKVPYRWVASMRNDYDMDAPGHNTAAGNVVSVMIRDRGRPGLVRTKPFHGTGHATDYGQADWFWLAQRAAADRMASVLNASCGWLRCMQASYKYEDMANERLLVEWALRGGLSITKMPPPRAPSSASGYVGPEYRSLHARRCDARV